MPTKKLEIPYNKLSDFCRRWQITELALFGSILRDDFSPDSDIDLLASFSPKATWTLLDHVEMQEQLREILGQEVDLVTRQGLKRSRNYLRSQAILTSAEVIYEES